MMLLQILRLSEKHLPDDCHQRDDAKEICSLNNHFIAVFVLVLFKEIFNKILSEPNQS